MKIITGDIPILHTPITPTQFYQEYISKRKPVILDQWLTRDWQAMSKWNLDYFNTRYGNELLYIGKLRRNGLSHPPNYEKQMQLSQFLCKHLPKQEEFAQKYKNDLSVEYSEDDWYYVQQVSCRYFPQLDQDYTIPDLFEASKYSTLTENALFIGCTRTRTTLHFDRPLVDNLFCQISGEKRIRLFEPHMGKFFYPFGFDTKYPHVSRIPEVDMDCLPQQQRQMIENNFPDHNKAQVIADFILQPGESLFIPKGYWHHISHETVAISLNFWYY
jgi:hypothetical protein